MFDGVHARSRAERSEQLAASGMERWEGFRGRARLLVLQLRLNLGRFGRSSSRGARSSADQVRFGLALWRLLRMPTPLGGFSEGAKAPLPYRFELGAERGTPSGLEYEFSTNVDSQSSSARSSHCKGPAQHQSAEMQCDQSQGYF
jgi:hypothetical protein